MPDDESMHLLGGFLSCPLLVEDLLERVLQSGDTNHTRPDGMRTRLDGGKHRPIGSERTARSSCWACGRHIADVSPADSVNEWNGFSRWSVRGGCATRSTSMPVPYSLLMMAKRLEQRAKSAANKNAYCS